MIRPDGSLDRTRLGGIVFADAEARRDLERITHPRIIELIQERIAAALAGPAPLVVVDIPLLFENAREAMFEGVLLVYAPPRGPDPAAARTQRTRRGRLRCNGLPRSSRSTRSVIGRRGSSTTATALDATSRAVDDVVGDASSSSVRVAPSPSSSTSSICVSSPANAGGSSRRSVPIT